MILQDCADTLLGILYSNPEKIDRRLLAQYSLRAEMFSYDKSQEILFRIISLASYADKKVNDTFISAYASKHKLTEEQVDDVKFALERVQEQETNFTYLPESVQVFKKELKTYSFKRLLLTSNDDLNKGEKSIDDILVDARQELQSIS